MPTDRPLTLLFLCSGNYYRSRFAEIYFNRLATRSGLNWRAYSRGLKPTFSGNPGPMALAATTRLLGKGIFSPQYLRFPVRARVRDFDRSDLVIALKESEHRPFMEQQFNQWKDAIVYWEIHDVDVAPPSQTLPILEERIMELVSDLGNRDLPHQGSLNGIG